MPTSSKLLLPPRPFRLLSLLLPSCLLAAGVLSAAPPPALLLKELQRISVEDAPEIFGVTSYGGQLHISGDTAIFLGSGTPGTPTALAVYIFVNQNGTWTYQHRIGATEVAAFSEFGHAIAIDGDTLVISASAEAKGAIQNAGCLLVYQRTNGVWNFEAKIQADDAASGDFLGDGIAIDGDTILTMAHGDAADAGNNAGNAYFFHRQDGVWTQQGQLPTNRDARLMNPYEERPLRVALHGDLAVVGAPFESTSTGRAYLFRRNGGTWTADGTLVPQGGAAYDFFGACVAMDEETLMIGAVQSGVAGGDGEVHVYQRGNNAWVFQEELDAGNPEGIDPTLSFGATLSLKGDTALIGGPGAGINGQGSTAGSAYIFRRKNGDWTKLRRLLPDGSDNGGTGFGTAMDLYDRDSMLIVNKEDIPGSGVFDPTLDNRGVVVFLGMTESSGPEIRLIAAADSNGDEALSEAEWNAMLPIAKPTLTLFKRLDTDNSGLLDYPELVAGTQSAGLPVTYRLWLERLRLAGELDTTEDLLLSRDEIAVMWLPSQGKSVDAFLKRLKAPLPISTYHWLRAKTIPSLPKYEAAKLLRSQRRTLAGELDTNADGFVSREEFVALFPANTAVAKIDVSWRSATATPKKGVPPAQITHAAFIEAPVLPKKKK